jgi:RimJ/RimL family protein N-acetyltransferase
MVAEYFGYIGESSLWGKGLGKEILSLTCDKASELGMEKVYLHVLSDNIRALRLYEKNGFAASSEEDGLITMWKDL